MRAAQDIQEVSTNSMNKALSSQKLLENLIPNITKNSVLVQEITSASIEQASGTAQINQAILQLTQVTQSNSVASEELASTAEQLSSHAEMLVKTISFFNKNLISASDLNLEMEARIKKLTSELDAMKTENKKLKTMVKSQPKANGILLDLSTSPETSIDNEFESFT